MKRMYLDIVDFDVAYRIAKDVTNDNPHIEIKSITFGKINDKDHCIKYGYIVQFQPKRTFTWSGKENRNEHLR